MKKTIRYVAASIFAAAAVFSMCSCNSDTSKSGNKNGSKCEGYVVKSPVNKRYLALTTGETYIPIGMNICFPRFLTEEEAVFADFEKKFAELSKNGGNYVRIWLSHPFFEIEDKKQGEYNPQKIARVDRLFDLADKYGIRMKLCFENFIALEIKKSFFTFNSAPPFDKRIYFKPYGGSFETIDEFFTTQKGKDVYLARARVFAQRYADRKCVFAWEIWNESSCITVKNDRYNVLKKWNSEVFAELHKMFPKHLVVMCLQSYDNKRVRELAYPIMNVDPQNDVTQIHNYLNEGHALPIAKEPTDIMCADAVNSMLKLTPDKPVLFAEVGAASPNHSAGPSKYYETDTEGIFLHDQTFTPFFLGSAGNGMSWHWEYYVQKHNLWHVFGRFAKAIAGIDPVAEDFKPHYFETANMRVYLLDGKKTLVAYCRDKNNSWATELRDKIAAKPLVGEKISLKKFVPAFEKASVYQPYADRESEVAASDGAIVLPDFMRSAVMRIKK